MTEKHEEAGSMQETLALIDQIIREHKIIIEELKSSEQVASDAAALIALERAKEDFVPGRFDQGQGLQKLQGTLAKVDKGLREHFNREETGLLAAFEKQGDMKLITTLNSLLTEHKDLRSRLTQSKEDVAKLTGGKLASQQWQAIAGDMRVHLSHTRKLLEAHAAIENELLVELRRHLKG